MGESEKQEDGAAGQEEVKYRGWKAMPYVVGMPRSNGQMGTPIDEHTLLSSDLGFCPSSSSSSSPSSIDLLVAGNETFEKLGTIGTSSNLVVYLTTVFNMKSVTAATLVNVWNGTTNIATIPGAFLSDAYFGRFATLGFASVASFLGMVVITLTAAVPSLHPHSCGGGVGGEGSCEGPSRGQLAILMTGLGLLVVGAGGIRPCNLAFGADQFDPKTESGKRGVNSFFNWYYFTFTVAMMISSTFIIYVQSNVNWSVGLAIPAALMLLSCAFFFVGSPIYVKVRPEGSPFAGVAQVASAAFRKLRLPLPEEGHCPSPALFNPPPAAAALNTRLPHTHQFRFLDKASIVTSKDEIEPNGLAANPWRLCSLQQVEEVKCLLRVIPIWSTGMLYYVAIVQQHTYVVFGSLQSDRHLGSTNFLIPAASFTVFAMLALTIWIPIYDRIMVPWLRRVTGKEEGITLLQRMGVGIILSIVAMITSALVEERRRRIALHFPTNGISKNGGAISSMSSLWLIPQLIISGTSEAFNLIGQVEFYYKQFPENMRSVAGSFLFCGLSIASYLSGFLVTVVHSTTKSGGGESWLAEDLNRGKLDYFYYLIAGLECVNFFYFLVCARWYKYKGSSEVELVPNSSKNSPV